ncbi:unnamed protein product [Penicillium roqueforti FM164]|uniref:Genomic scaffold, ProqFM164S01 n=1 Tax=Penicillium roqueforti (strain FM164) TaxID=1365484 RepID=W6PVD5_PENRF|nr:unnamed protein product [Penicillium roqueforti FM164]
MLRELRDGENRVKSDEFGDRNINMKLSPYIAQDFRTHERVDPNVCQISGWCNLVNRNLSR